MRHGYFTALHVFVVVLAALVLFLAVENRRLEARAPGEVAPLSRGEAWPALDLRELDGEPAELRFGDGERPGVALVFTTTCKICQENLDSWQKLYDQLAASHELVGIGVDDTEAVRAYARRHFLPFRVVTPADRLELVRALRIRGVPQTIFVDAQGRVEEVLSGPFAGRGRAGMTR